ncbi:MAG: hypothetical protein ACLGHM_02830 [Actinomycetes bacterium]
MEGALGADWADCAETGDWALTGDTGEGADCGVTGDCVLTGEAADCGVTGDCVLTGEGLDAGVAGDTEDRTDTVDRTDIVLDSGTIDEGETRGVSVAVSDGLGWGVGASPVAALAATPTPMTPSVPATIHALL